MSWKFMIARIAPDADVSEIVKNLDKRLFCEVMFSDSVSTTCECAARLPPSVTPERMVAADSECAKDESPEKTGDVAVHSVGGEQPPVILEKTCLAEGMDAASSSSQPDRTSGMMDTSGDSTYVTCCEESQVVGDEQRGAGSPLNHSVSAEGVTVKGPDTPRVPLDHSVLAQDVAVEASMPLMSLDHSLEGGAADCCDEPTSERANRSIAIAQMNDFDASRKTVEDRDNETEFPIDGMDAECDAMDTVGGQSESQMEEEEEFGTEKAMDGEEEQVEKRKEEEEEWQIETEKAMDGEEEQVEKRKEEEEEWQIETEKAMDGEEELEEEVGKRKEEEKMEKEEEKSKIETETDTAMDGAERQMVKGKEQKQINDAIDDNDEKEEKEYVNERKQCETQPPMAQPEQEEIGEDRTATGSEEGGAQMDAVFEKNDAVALPDDVPFDSRQTCAVCEKPVVVYCRSKPKKCGGQDAYVYRSSVLHHILPHLRRRCPAFPLQFACSLCKWQTARPYSITRHFKTCTKGRAVKVDWTREQLDMIRRMRKTCFPKLYGQR